MQRRFAVIPDYQALMRPVLECAKDGEVRISNVVDWLTNRFELSEQEQKELVSSGKQTRFANRVHWAKTYLKQAGLVTQTKWAHFIITDRGRAALADTGTTINNAYLEQFEEFKEFQTRTHDVDAPNDATVIEASSTATPDEMLREAHMRVNTALSAELLNRIRNVSPVFFEHLIVELLLAMGYGGTSEGAGRALGKSGDDGVDGVIDQDPLGVDQIYVQAKRYAQGEYSQPRLHSRLLRLA